MTKIIDPNDPGRLNAIVDEILDEHAKACAVKTLRTVTPDEQVFVQAIAFYDAVTKSPEGFMHRKHVNTLTWILTHATDEGLRQCVDAMGQDLPDMKTPRGCIARVSAIILQRRGKNRQSVLVN